MTKNGNLSTSLTNQSDPRPRKTGLLTGTCFCIIAAWAWYRGKIPLAGALASLGGLLILTGLLLPSWAARFHKAWMLLASALGYVNSRILLCLFYFGLLTPLGAIMRWLGRDPLQRRRSQASSYWIPRSQPRQTRQEFEHTF